ncbi:BA14K family protein [Neorhizobium sp. DT-125]|uniref:BA14K family protein n=1 Tax=Neorhizobium sp. DT-125 TaxID=3396163 RepID=UPI003F1D4B0A
MKPVLLLLASLVLVVLVFLSGVVITANVIAEPEPHRLANMDTPDLWTSKPKPIDTSKQHYERVPPGTPSASIAADAERKPDAQMPGQAPAPQSAAAAPNAGAENTEIDDIVTGSVDPKPPARMDARAADIGNPPQPAPMVSPAHAEWCYARYRSYRVEDNSYQPYNGLRRQCRPPGTRPDVAAVSSEDPQQRELRAVPDEEMPADDFADYAEPRTIGGDAPVGAHEEWCFVRYRSYRVEDNSCQPFDGSPRRQCQSPYG